VQGNKCVDLTKKTIFIISPLPQVIGRQWSVKLLGICGWRNFHSKLFFETIPFCRHWREFNYEGKRVNESFWGFENDE
jgi:hypothetical protein